MRYLFILFLGFSTTLFSQQFYSKKQPFAHTYSIVARDTITGDMAVAVQSHWFSVGSIVTWGKAGVGVVATQSFVNPSFGPRGLNLLENGLTPELAVKTMLALDEGRDVRQLAILDANGNVAAFTGEKCIDAAGHIVGNNFSVQANLMDNSTVWDAMANAFENSSGTLAERVLLVLEAAEKEGGDIRGKQSAAMLVVKGKSTGNKWEDVLVDLRVDDHENPLKELRRLLNVHTAYEYMNKGDVAVEKGDFKQAKLLYKKAQDLNPNNLEMQYWYAITLLNNNEIEEAKSILKTIFAANNKWKKLTPRLIKSGLLQISEKDLTKIMAL